MADPLSITLHASGAETASGSGSAVDIGPTRSAARLTLDVSAVEGTFGGSEGLTVSVETSPNGATGWTTIESFPLLASTGFHRLTLTGLERYVRATWTISGTDSPEFAFALAGEAHVLYVQPHELERYIRAEALEDLSVAERATACLSATDYADSKLRRRYTMPLVSWSEDLTAHCAYLAIFHALNARGFDPEGPDVLIVDNAKAARKELESIGAGNTTPNIVDSTPTKRGTAPRVHSRARTSRWDD